MSVQINEFIRFSFEEEEEMLVLSRRCDTAIHIGRDIKVTVLSIQNRQVRLGVEAPRSVHVWRNELCCADPSLLEDENESALADNANSKLTVQPGEKYDGSFF